MGELTSPIATIVAISILSYALFSTGRHHASEKKELANYRASLVNLSATRHETNGVDYLSIPFNGQEIKLFQYNGIYQTSQNITQQETQKAARQVESNLVERTGGLK